MAQWMELQAWIFPQRFFRENLNLGEGGEEGRDNDIARETFERTGASVMGKRMFDLGEQAWPEEAPSTPPCSSSPTSSATPGNGRAGPRSTSSTTASTARWARPARSPTTGTFASPAAVRRSGAPQRRPGRRVLDRALTSAVRRRHPPVRRRGHVQGHAGAGPFGAVVAGDAPDLRRASTVAATTPPLRPEHPRHTRLISRPPRPTANSPLIRTRRSGLLGKVLIEQLRGADVVVVGHRGRGGSASVVLGSVGLQCVLHAQCPLRDDRGLVDRRGTPARPGGRRTVMPSMTIRPRGGHRASAAPRSVTRSTCRGDGRPDTPARGEASCCRARRSRRCCPCSCALCWSARPRSPSLRSCSSAS